MGFAVLVRLKRGFSPKLHLRNVDCELGIIKVGILLVALMTICNVEI